MNQKGYYSTLIEIVSFQCVNYDRDFCIVDIAYCKMNVLIKFEE